MFEVIYLGMSEQNRRDIPLGFGMALAQNSEAMRAFSNLSEQEQKQCVERTHQIGSKSEMRSFVQSIADNQMF